MFQSCSDIGAEPVVAIAFLVLCSGSPKMQFFADCVLEEDDGRGVRTFSDRSPPFDIKIADRVGRLGRLGVDGRHRSISMSTSDELVRHLLATRPSWTLFPLGYEIPDGACLLQMHVTEKGEEIICSKRARARLFSWKMLLPDVLALGDPFEHGAASVQPPSAPPVSSGDRASRVAAAMEVDNESGDDYDIQADVSGEEEEQEFDDLPFDQLEDMLEDMSQGLIGPEACQDRVGPEEEETCAPSMEAALAAIAVAEGDRPEQSDDGGGQCSEAFPSFQMDDHGYIKTAVEPWSAYAHVGRISVWPAAAPREKQNVAIKCWLHPGCSLSRKRAKVTDQQLIAWIFAAQPCPASATRAEQAIAAILHKAKSSMLAQIIPTASGAASSSTSVS